MAIDFEEMFAELETTLESTGSVGDRMAHLLKFANDRAPSRQWQDLLEVQYDADVSLVSAWLEGLFSRQPPDDDIVGFWFGTEEIWQGEIEGRRGVYLIGSRQFDADDNEWAFEASYEPSPRAVNCPSMCRARTILDHTQDYKITSSGEYIAELALAAMLVQAALRLVYANSEYSFLGNKQALVGFGSGGDYLRLGAIGAIGSPAQSGTSHLRL